MEFESIVVEMLMAKLIRDFSCAIKILLRLHNNHKRHFPESNLSLYHVWFVTEENPSESEWKRIMCVLNCGISFGKYDEFR